MTIGETYNFEGAGRDGNDLAGTVTAATVIESEHRIAVAVTDSAGKAFILKEPINDEQLAEYRANPDAYFGKVVPAQRKAESPYDLFKFFMEAYKGLERTTLLEKLGGASPELDEMSDDALLILYCERLATAAVRMTSSKMT